MRCHWSVTLMTSICVIKTHMLSVPSAASSTPVRTVCTAISIGSVTSLLRTSRLTSCLSPGSRRQEGRDPASDDRRSDGQRGQQPQWRQVRDESGRSRDVEKSEPRPDHHGEDWARAWPGGGDTRTSSWELTVMIVAGRDHSEARGPAGGDESDPRSAEREQSRGHHGPGSA